jgi:hypothetical protein
MRDDGYVCYWPMPVFKHFRIEFENAGATPVTVSANVSLRKGVLRDAGYFHAQWHRQTTVAGEHFHILQTAGRGHYVGEHTDMQGDRGIWFLEGDEKISVDGQRFPSIHGTGTEDFYTGGWYFDEGPFNMAYHGCTLKSDELSRVAAYRYQIQDCVPFQQNIRVDIEHGGTNDYPGADYSCVAYWYQTTPDHDWSPIVRDQLTPAVYRVAGALEAESLEWPAGMEQTVDDRDLPVEASAGKVAVVSGDRPAFTLSVDQEDVYTLDLAQIVMPDGAGEIGITGSGPYLSAIPSADRPDDALARWTASFPVHLMPGKATLALVYPAGKKVYLDYVRLSPSRKEPGVIEAETLAGVAASHGDVLAPFDAGPDFSGRRGLLWRPMSDGDSLRIPITLPAAGSYAFTIALQRSATSPTVVPAIDGAALPPVNTALPAGQQRYDRMQIARAPGLSQGAHTLTLTYTAASGTEAPALRLDYIRIRKSLYANSVLGEDLKILEAKDGEAQEQEMAAFGTGWSGDRQFWFTAQKVGAEATLELPIATAGRYELSAYYTTARDYGIVQVLVDGQAVGTPTDGYTTDVRPKGKTVLGPVTLSAGPHRLTFRVTGKNASSVGYLVGVDAIGLDPLP